MSDIPPQLKPSEPSDEPAILQPAEAKAMNPILAGAVAVFPGAGHMVLGRGVQGGAFMTIIFVMVALLYWARTTSEFEVAVSTWLLLVLMLIAFYLYTIVSAVALAGGARTFYPGISLVLALGFAYVLGWQATEVNLQKFFSEFDDTFTIFARVMFPFSAVTERDIDERIVEAEFLNPCPENGVALAQSESPVDGAVIAVAPGCGEFSDFLIGEGEVKGTPLVVEGKGFEPGELVTLYWEDPIGDEFRPLFQGEFITAMPDADGSFRLEFDAPRYSTPAEAVGIQEHKVQARQVRSVGAIRPSSDFLLAVNRLLITIFQALLATSLGIIFAFPLSFFAARNLMWNVWYAKAIYLVNRFLMNVSRSIEPIIWAVIAVAWVGLGPFAGVLALTIHTVASLVKLYSEAIESIDPGPIEAVTSTGATPLQTVLYAIVPQIVPPYLSFTVYRWDINVRMSTIIGFVGGGGIGQILYQWINQSKWNSAGIAVWLIVITVSLLDYASSELRKRFI